MSRTFRTRRGNNHFSWTVRGFHKGIKEDKRLNNSSFRAISKSKVREAELSYDVEGIVYPQKLEESSMDRWDYIDDGRSYYPDYYIDRDIDNPWIYRYK